MPEDNRPDVKARRRRERRIWRGALLVSVVAHLLVFLSWTGDGIPDSPYAAAGPRAGDDRAAEGSMQAVSIRVPQAEPERPPPVPVVTTVEVEPVEFEDELVVDGSVADDAPGTLEAPGRADGEGQGDAGTADEGLNRVNPPTPRGMIIPPSHDALKGRELEVWVFVDPRGRVVADSTRLRPPTSDSGFNERLMREAAEWVFNPATKGGEPVASWVPYTISME